ncbi:MAG: hypothetical protein S0880_23010 [Actinomycetota bacterium]|nr:hypothetical protein [Actinomycetota bacterium]
MTLPDEVLAVIGEPEVVADAEGRLDVLSACRHLELHHVSALVELAARGRLHPVRDGDGMPWFDRDELDAVARSGAVEEVRAGDEVDVWFGPDELAAIDAVTCETGETRAGVVRRLVRESLGIER